MRLLIARIIFAFTLASAAIGTHAAAVPTAGRVIASDPSAPTILFLNGIRNSFGQSVNSSEALIASYTAIGRLPAKKYNHRYLYNPSDGWLGVWDLFELAEQTSRSDQHFGKQIELGAWYNSQFMNLRNLDSRSAEYRIVQFSGLLRDEMKSILQQSESLVVVPHSQGNLYAEAAYAMLAAEGRQDLLKRIRIVGVANTAATTPNGRYITHHQDQAINLSLKGQVLLWTNLKLYYPMDSNSTGCVRTLVPFADQCGVFLPWLYFDKSPFAHSFENIYLQEEIFDQSTRSPFPQIIYGYISDSLQELSNSIPGDLPTAGLIGYWNFNDCTATDTSGTGNSGSLVGSPVCTTGYSGKGIRLNSNNWVQVPDSASLDLASKFTMSVWFKADALVATRSVRLIDKTTAGAADGYALVVYSEGLALNGVSGAPGAAGSNQVNVSNGVYHHAVVTFDNGALAFFLDGQNVGRSTTSNTAVPVNSLPLRIGASQGVLGGPLSSFAGVIDEVRMYNVALSDAEVANLFSGTIPTPPVPPNAWPNSCNGKSTVLGSWTTFGTTTWNSSTNAYVVGDLLASDPGDADGDCNQVTSWFGASSQDNDWLIYNQAAHADVDFSADACITFSPVSGHFIGLFKEDSAFANQPRGGHSPLGEQLASFFTMWNRPGQLMYSIGGSAGIFGNVSIVPLTPSGYCAVYRLNRTGDVYNLYVNGALVKSATATIAPVHPTVMAYDNVVTIKPTVKID